MVGLVILALIAVVVCIAALVGDSYDPIYTQNHDPDVP